MNAKILAGAHWQVSTYSNGDGDGDQCVEVAVLPAVIAVRDSKDRAGAVHLHSGAAWREFLAGVRRGEFDR